MSTQAQKQSKTDLEHFLGLSDLLSQRFATLEQVNELAVVHLEQHARDLAGKRRLGGLDAREELLSNHLLLLFVGCSSQLLDGERCSLASLTSARQSRLGGTLA